MKYRSIIITLFSVIALYSSLSADNKKLGKTIEITKESYSDIYEAVWFDPNQGTIHKIVELSEKPPVKGALIWIEPSDPELALAPNIEDVFIYYIGDGEELFNSHQDYSNTKSIKKAKKSVLKNGKKPVFIIKTPLGESTIIVDHSSENKFKYRWKKLASK